jgi:hypothetical protein
VPSPDLSRRAFLTLGGAALLLAACGGDDSKSGKTATTVNGNNLTTAVMSSDLYVSPSPQRLAFIALTQKHAYASGAAATVAIEPPHGTRGAATNARLYRTGLPKNRGVYVVEPTLGTAGIYTAFVTISGQKIELPFQVNAKATAPTVGTAAPHAASPTKAKPLGVHPLCTRSPQCPLHEKSLGDVIGKGRPVAVMFATPALCQSAYCGPVLDTMLPFATQYRDTIDFVHIEIYRDLSGTNVSPTVDAWHLASEPWLFTIDGSGTIVGRLDGAFGSEEIDAHLKAVVSR